jgi:hypothetical protein
MGTGVGEAMLISAVTGAGTSAITGGDPLKGALMGAALGGVGGAVAGAGTTAGAAGGAAAPIGTAATTGAGTAGTIADTAMGLETFNQAAAAAPIAGPATMITPAGDVSLASMYTGPGATTAGQTAGQMAGTGAGSPTFPSINKFYANNPIMMPAGLGIAGAAMVPPERLDEKEKYSGPLSRFSYDPDRYRPAYASGGLADTAVARRYMKGGHLGSYSDGGRLLKGPGDGMSDNIPAKIGEKQPARLADGEFVIPADVVSGLGNGSTDAGARKLYAMMDKVRQARTGKKSQGKEINANKYMPA